MWYWSGFKAYYGLDLVRIGTRKWSGFGPILINLGPILQVVALVMAELPFVSFKWAKSLLRLVEGDMRTLFDHVAVIED